MAPEPVCSRPPGVLKSPGHKPDFWAPVQAALPMGPQSGQCQASLPHRQPSQGPGRMQLHRVLTHAIRCCEGSPGPQDVSWQWRHPRRCRDAPSGVDVGCNSGNHAAWQGLPRHHGPWAGHLACGGIQSTKVSMPARGRELRTQTAEPRRREGRRRKG